MSSINFNNLQFPKMGSVTQSSFGDQNQGAQFSFMPPEASIFSMVNSSNSSNPSNDFDFSNMGNYDDSSNGGFWKTFLGMFRGPEQSNSASNQQNPQDAYAQKYADEHGMTLDEAKEELKSTYGDPQAPDTQEFQLTGDPEADAKNYADLKGISLDEAKEELQNLYGKREQLSAEA